MDSDIFAVVPAAPPEVRCNLCGEVVHARPHDVTECRAFIVAQRDECWQRLVVLERSDVAKLGRQLEQAHDKIQSLGGTVALVQAELTTSEGEIRLLKAA